MQDWSLFDDDGKRKYLTLEERSQFYDAVPKALKREQRPFALMIYWSGCRISEALNVEVQHLDYSENAVRFKTLKRRKDVYRTVPLPPAFMEKLDDVYNVKARQRMGKKELEQKLWSFTRRCGTNYIKKVMNTADIIGKQATAKGLRHSFVIFHQQHRTPAHMIQRWAGWSTPAMLEIYGRAMGEEEQELASILWKQ